LWGILGAPLLILPFISYSLKGYPWTAFVIGVVIAAGLLWYSKSTEHARWVRR
jgi:hypothetical protein